MSTAIGFWQAIEEELDDLAAELRPVKAYVGSEVNGRVSLRFPGQTTPTAQRYPRIAGPQFSPDTPVYCLKLGKRYLVLGRVSDGTWDGGGDSGGSDHPAVTVSDTSSIDLTIDASQHLTAAAKFGTSAGTVAEGNHTHDSRYYTESEVDTKLAGKANTSHTHAIGDVSGLQAALDGKAASSHTHTAAQVTDFDDASFDALVAALQEGSNVTLAVDTNAKTITISADGGGGGSSHPAVTVVDSSSIDLTIDGNQQLTAVAKFGTSAGTVAEGNHLHDGRYSQLGHTHSFNEVFPINGTIDGGPFNVRSAPNTSGAVLGSATHGTPFHDTGKRASGSGFQWAYIWLDGLTWCWVITDALEP